MPAGKAKKTKLFPQLRADAVRNRTAILDAAEEIFDTQGPALSTEEVARRASVGVGTLFRHFPTKEALLLAIVVTRLERLTKEANALAVDDRGEALFHFFERIVRQSAHKRTLVHAMSAQGVNMEALMRAAGAGFRAAVGDLLVRAQKRGIVRPDVEVSDVLDLLRALAYVSEPGAQESGAQNRVLAIVLDGLRCKGEN